MIHTQIYTAISQNQDVIAIVGSKVYPMRKPQGVSDPSVVYKMQLVESVKSVDGDSGLDSYSLEVRSWARDYATAQELSSAVRDALLGAAGIKITTEAADDDEDIDTENYCVVTNYTVWSTYEGDALNPILEIVTYSFTGDGVTTSFPFTYAFRAGSLIMFRNGTIMKKNDKYTEKTDRTGIDFTVAPKGGTYPDEFLAYYAKA